MLPSFPKYRSILKQIEFKETSPKTRVNTKAVIKFLLEHTSPVDPRDLLLSLEFLHTSVICDVVKCLIAKKKSPFSILEGKIHVHERDSLLHHGVSLIYDYPINGPVGLDATEHRILLRQIENFLH